MKKRILIICSGNSCRSQMAEGFLRSIDPGLMVLSAGTNPEKEVNPKAIYVMKEGGIDISKNHPKNVEQFIYEKFDYVITVCDAANEACPVFTGNVKHRLHMGFEDPAKATGTEEEKLLFYRKIRDEIFEKLYEFYKKELRN